MTGMGCGMAWAAGVLGLLAAVGEAQEAASPQAAAQPQAQRIGVIDMERLERETVVGKDYLRRIEELGTRFRAEGTKRQERLAEMGQEIQRQGDEFRRQQPSMTPAVAEEAQRSLARKVRERELYQQASEQEMALLERRFQRDSDRLRKELRQQLVPSIEAIIRKHSIDLLLDYHLCLAVGQKVDLTDDAIRTANEAEEKASAKPASGPAAAPK